MEEIQPLVSVPVITYNSSKTVVETLDSIYNQTYPKLELIVSDDCSSDNTVEICGNWIEAHKNRFARIVILTSEKNTGVSANMNRAEKACQGEWVKGIAGDDLLLPDCIQCCVEYVIINPETCFLFGRMEGFGKEKEVVEEYMSRCFDYSFFQLTPTEQYERLVFKGNCVPAPTLFYHLKNYHKLGIINDERIPMIEDYPKWMNLTKLGVKLHFLDKVIVRYRLSPNAISSTSSMSPLAKKSVDLIYIYYLFPEYWKKSKIKALHKYVDAAYMVWGGWWTPLYWIDQLFVRFLR